MLAFTHTTAHISVLLPEAVAALAIEPEGVYVDATFGRGGHSRAILAKLGAKGRLLALDRDPAAIEAGRALTDSRFTLCHRPFSELSQALDEAGIAQVDGVLFDLGVSSPQLDDPARGFSFRADAPLDMRMDTTRGETAAEWLAYADIKSITEVLKNYGEERFAFQVAKKIIAVRAERPVTTTGALAALIRETVRSREPGQDPATRSFQALRLHVNEELREIEVALPQALARLNPGGRLAVIAFHSLEDRIVKRFIRAAANPAAAVPSHLPLRAGELPQPALIAIGKARRPSAAEVVANPRARSAVLRVAEKC
ncbi:MAG: 16S rRNA (cytosine(1402)-N(4))-methyltransferase RsmH [Zoogloeaceae bacterium]|jgi:16S rRNA (cytosine1402-N4)-methyltransferase|nr:16S rRNA (cytosine(1402)-N(4))-methyltransferase RsmH [Zoogloeaceae bacterium]